MDPKLELVKTITLIYKESQLDHSTGSTALARELLGLLKIPETGVDFDKSREVLIALRSTLNWLLEQPEGERVKRSNLLQRIRVNVGDDEGLYFAFEQAIAPDLTQEELKAECVEASRELKRLLNNQKVTAILRKASQAVMFESDAIDWKTFVSDVYAELEPFAVGNFDDKPDGLVDSADFANPEDIVRVMTRGADEVTPAGIMRLGWQALNRMFGDHGGVRRGETIVVGALQHNFKTGFTLTGFFKHTGLYNSPWMIDATKKPLILHLSFEDDLQKNILSLFKNLKENETGTVFDMSYFNTAENEEEKQRRIVEAADYIRLRMTATGYNIQMKRFNPSEFTFLSYYSYITKLESEGYEIHLVVADYLNMISKRGCDEGASGQSVRDLFRRMRNFNSARSIAFITPHQLSTEAKALTRDGVKDLVKEIANKGYYDSCKTIDQEVDMEIYIHRVQVNGKWYLTVQRGKHRKVSITPEEDLYFVLPFEEAGALRDDVHGVDTSMKKAGGPELEWAMY